MKTVKMFRANLNCVTAVDMHPSVNEHVDAGTWEAFGKSAEQAKSMLCAALESRVRSHKETLQIAEKRLAQAQAIKGPQ